MDFGIVNDTPLDIHMIRETPVLVKREDLCCPFPGPQFSKIRGVAAHITKRPEQTIGVLDTFHSKAGWAVSYVCAKLGKQAINFWPRYKGRPPQEQQDIARKLGAGTIALDAGRSAILYHAAKKDLARRYPGSYMMPNALKLPESVEENEAEARRTVWKLPSSGTLVISVSSGTVASGVLRGFRELVRAGRYSVVLHMGYSRSTEACRGYIEEQCGYALSGSGMSVCLVDEGYAYADFSKVDPPFPCNPFYDAKAWEYISRPGAVECLRQPVVFWNIGA